MRRHGIYAVALITLGVVAWLGWGRRSAPAPVGFDAPSAPAAHPDGGTRAHRDELRTKILRALMSDAAAAPPVASAPLPPPTPTPEHAPRDLRRGLAGIPASNLPTAYIADIYKEQLGPMTRACYDAARAKAPDAGGTVMISYIVVGAPNIGGIVEDANVDESSLADPDFETCIHESVLSLTFDRAPNEGGWKEAGFAMQFSPPDGG